MCPRRRWTLQVGVQTGPLVESGLVLDCLELAADARVLDMRASPYDLRDFGFAPIAIETRPAREYARPRRASVSGPPRCGPSWLDRCEAAAGTAAGG